MSFKTFSAFVFILTSLFSLAFSLDLANGLNSRQEKFLQPWLAANNYRLATASDNNNHSCQPKKTPYYLSGDFTGDKIEDLAVVVVDKSNPENAQFLVFNGPFKKTSSPIKPALLQPLAVYREGGLGTHEKEIFFCVCETDNCAAYQWNGKTYERQPEP